jgi:hypothetical protein
MGVMTVMVLALGRCPIPNKIAVTMMASQIIRLVGFPSVFFLILENIQIMKVIKNSLNSISSPIPP